MKGSETSRFLICRSNIHPIHVANVKPRAIDLCILGEVSQETVFDLSLFVKTSAIRCICNWRFICLALKLYMECTS